MIRMFFAQIALAFALSASTYSQDCTPANYRYATLGERAVTEATTIVVGTLQRARFVEVRKNAITIRGNVSDTTLWCIEVSVENVLRGNVGASLSVAYFGDNGDLSQIKPGVSRNVFLLRIEKGVYRLAADDSAGMLPIFTGAHPGFQIDPARPIEDTIMDFVVVQGKEFRGEFETGRMAAWIGHEMRRPWRVGLFLDKLLHSPDREVRAGACRVLVERFLVRQSCLNEFKSDKGPGDWSYLWQRREVTDAEAMKRLDELGSVESFRSKSDEERRFDLENLQVLLLSDSPRVRTRTEALLNTFRGH